MRKLWIFLFAAVGLILLGLCFYSMPGFDFSGLVCMGLAALAVCYWALLRFPGKIVKWLRRILTVCLILGLTVAAVTGIFIVSASKGTSDGDCDYIIVLGAGVNGTEPSLILSERLQAAKAYLTENEDAICIVSGGQGEGEQITEAACMQAYLVKNGIDENRIWMEEKATSTWENLEFSLALIEEKTGARPYRVGIISNEFHMFRAGMMARKMGLEMVGIPAKTSWVSLRINYFVREIVGVWKHIILGG